MQKTLLWLLLILTAFPACADPLDTNVGNPEHYVLPPAVSFPGADAIPGCSIGIGYQSLYREYLPASYCNIAIGYQVMQGKMTATAINNLGIGFTACSNITTGNSNICIGNGGTGGAKGAGYAITTGSRNIYLGDYAGSNISMHNDNIQLDPEGSIAAFSGDENVIVGTHSSWNGLFGTILGDDAGYSDAGVSYHTLIGANVARTTLGSGGTGSNAIFIGGNVNTPQSAILDAATSSTASVIGVGLGHPGTGDTEVGYGALNAVTADNEDSAAFGYNALQALTSGTHNSSYGYQACKTVTTGGSNLCVGYNAASATLTTGGSDIIIGSGITSLASGTSNEINIGGLVFANNTSTAVPVISACGTSPNGSVDSKANAASGTVTVGGTTATSCTITFASAYSTWAHCRVTSQTAIAALSYSNTTAAITISAVGSILGGVFDYVCDGY